MAWKITSGRRLRRSTFLGDYSACAEQHPWAVIVDAVSLFVGFAFSGIATKRPHSSLQSATSLQIEEHTDRADLDSIVGGSAFSLGHVGSC